MPRDDRTKQAFEMIEEGVKDVFSSENFKNYLSCLSKFHSYSLNNTLLILSQNPQASLVAGYNSWAENFNRHVNKGEKAIKILAPYDRTVKVMVDKKDADGNVMVDAYGNAEQEEIQRKMTSFMVVNVFDISQTSGDPLPSLMERDLTGSSLEVEALIDSIVECSEIPVSFKLEVNDQVLKDGAKGYFDNTGNKIVVKVDMDEKQIAKTLAHEYAHSLIHKDTDKPRYQREIEAEALAFVICDHFGIDTSDYSFTYVAAYASEHPEELKKILLDIHSNAHEIIEMIEPVFEQKLLKAKQEHSYEAPQGDEIQTSVERKNYVLLEKFALPILAGDAYYMKLSCPGMMDLHVEKIEDDRIALSHYYKQNGDMMADPDMEFTFDTANRLLIAETYQQDNLSYFVTAEDSMETAQDLNYFASDWLQNIQNNRYRIREIGLEGKNLNTEDSYKDLKNFCSNYGLTKMVDKRREGVER